MFTVGELLSGDSYLLTGLSVANGLTAALVLVIGIAILLKGKMAPPAIAFFVVAVAAAAWLICDAMMFASGTPELAIFWARAGLVPIGVIGAATLHFTIRNLRPLQRRLLAVICWIVLPLVGAVGAGSPAFINGIRYHSWGYYPVATALTGGIVGIFLGAMLPATFVLWRASRRSHGPAQESAHALALASILGLFAFVDYLPAAGVEIYPAGYMAVFAFAIVGGSALWRYHLIDLTPEYAAAQILETMKSAVLVVDMDARIRVANRGAYVLLGYADGELIGQPLRRILDPEREISTSKLLNSSGVLEQTMVWLTASGARIDILASSSFVRDADGAPLGVIYVASDYTDRRKNDEELRESELRYRTLFDNNPLPMWVYDFESLQFISVNDEALRHYGYTREEFLSMKMTDIRPQEDVASVLALLPQLPTRVTPAIFRHKKKDGSIIDVDISSFEFVSGGRRRRLVMARDVTELRRSERLLRESEARYRLLFERNLAGVYRTTADGRVLDANDAFARIFGYSTREELLSIPASSLYFENSEREQLIADLRKQRSLTNLEVRMRRRDGSAVWVIENMTLIEGSMPEILEGTIIDVTDRKYAQEEMQYRAYHDILTGLPNRLLFRDRIGVALAHARRTARAVAIMFFDLDHFKNVNDSLGHTVGDRLLQSVGMRLVANVRAEDTVARMGGDEFTVLLSDVADGRGAATVARKILDSVSAPIVIDGHELKVTTSIGIAVFPGDGFDAETLLRNADRAMYRAKQLGRNNYQYATTPPLDDRLMLERRLAQAIDQDELILHYQPIVEIATQQVVGAEALVRWNDPSRGVLPPESFIPAAEESELILTIGDWVMRTGCAQMKQWHDRGLGRLRLAVNLSPRQFAQRDLASRIGRILEETKFPGNCLELEITESTVMQNAEAALSTMMMLKGMGVRISIDDFGTGYSSLSYLKRFPIDTLKIDQEFVRDLSADANDQAIITAVVSMARALKLRVVAEGVETEAQLGFLQREECAEMQGFLYSRPVAPAEFEEALRRSSAVQRH